MPELREAILRTKLAVGPSRPARLGLLASLALHRFTRLYRKYDPDQPRDDLGRWTETGGGAGENDASLRDEEDIATGTVVTIRKDRVGDH